ncbi:MAG: hypothetical protein ABIL69_11545 [candidate division WOR-3 bacterium]
MKIEDILQTLEKYRVRYAVVGGVAVVLYGYIRFTKDIDLIVDFSRENVKRFKQAMDFLKFKPGPPIEPTDLADAKKRNIWIQEKNAKVITFYNPDQQMLQIDVLLTVNFSDIEVVRKKVGDFEISVIAYADLIKMKKQSGRALDLIDIDKLEELRKGSK